MAKSVRRGMTALACGLLATTAAIADVGRTTLPLPVPPFDGVIGETISTSKPAPLFRVTAPAGAPNVLVLMSDDVGFSMSSTFGGPVPTPNFDRLARTGQRYNRFHTTGVCSPSRAALLTGRNHHNAGNGFLSDLPAGYPGYAGKISPETATLAQILRLNGYNTAMFGKHHNTPTSERSAAGPFDSWPTGLGFEYFFGFMSGDSDQYSPVLFRGIDRVSPAEGQGKMLDRRLADEIINWVHNQKAAAPDKPFFAYWAPGSTHAPHQAPAELIASFKGKFDQGWDLVREQTWKRQLAMGIIPKGTTLTERPVEIPAWASLTAGQKAFAARTMEVAAAQLEYQDQQFGGVLDELQRMGQLDNTMIIVVEGDNGASGEAGTAGTINELRSIQTHDEDEATLEANIGNLGGPLTYENYPVGWAWAMNTPLRWVKQHASMLGGVRNGMIVSWPGHMANAGSVCAQFSHLVDIAPTVLEAAKLPAPELVFGYRQKPMDGVSLLSSFTAKCEPQKPRTQYFEIGGKIGFYSNGWFLSGDNGRPSWVMTKRGAPPAPLVWTLYDLDRDFSQSVDLAAKNPAKLAEMMALWKSEATRNQVFPIDDREPYFRADPQALLAARKRYEYWGKDISLPSAGGAPYLSGRSFTVEAEITLGKDAASGVVVADGSRFGGWSLFLDNGRPVFVWAKSTDPKEMARVEAGSTVPMGKVKLQLGFKPLGIGAGAEIVISANGKEIGRGKVPQSFLMFAGTGETFDTGRDIGVPVTNYRTPFGAIEGEISHIVITFD